MIYVDMDGVLADFDAAATVLFGRPPREAEEQWGTERFWKTIASKYNFYRTLPKMADADDLMAGVWRYTREPRILTGVPSSMPQVPMHKRTWAAEHYPGVQVITCFAREKANYCQPGDILIDDRPQYKGKWIDKGGLFITHTSAEASLAELHRVFHKTTINPGQADLRHL